MRSLKLGMITVPADRYPSLPSLMALHLSRGCVHVGDVNCFLCKLFFVELQRERGERERERERGGGNNKKNYKANKTLLPYLFYFRVQAQNGF